LAREGSDAESEATLADAAEAVCQKLGQRLERMITFDGYQALLSRALYLTSKPFPFVARIQPNSLPGRYLTEVRACIQDEESAHAHQGLAMLLASLIGLLANFIGDELTLRLVSDVWPGARLDGADTGAQEAQT
jgi:hypothetical protein